MDLVKVGQIIATPLGLELILITRTKTGDEL